MNPPSSRPKEIWFPAKTCGWGWGPPVRWQGWVVLGVYLAAVVIGSIVILDDPRRVPLFIGYSVALVSLLIAVCWWKGEKPQWRWPGKKPGEK